MEQHWRNGVDAKFDRARDHAARLREAVESYKGPNLLEVERREEAGGDVIYWVGTIRPVPIEWSLMLGDAVHNARSALDHLACVLVEAGGGTISKDTMFPIVDVQTALGTAIRSRLHGASHEVRGLVRSMRPFRGGGTGIYELHQLDILDKHRLIVPVFVQASGVRMTSTSYYRGEVDGVIRAELNIPGGEFVRSVGQVVFRTTVEAERRIGDDDIALEVKQEPTFDLAFGELTPISGRPLINGLRELIEQVAAAVEPLSALRAT